MPTPDSFGLEFREDTTLPARTLIAPIDVIREIRAALSELSMNIQVGWDSPAVVVSSDLFHAFHAWSAQQANTEEADPVDEGMYN